MRRRRSRRACIVAALLLVLLRSLAAAQSTTNEGAVFLLLPVGARAAATGQAAGAANVGLEGVWWNPATLALTESYEVALQHSQSLAATGDAVSLAVPLQLLGVLVVSANLINFGEQEVSDPGGGGFGIIVPRALVYAATFATDLGRVLKAGLTYKLVQLRTDCSGSCGDLETFTATTSAIDFGVVSRPVSSLPLDIGVSVRNLGLKLQVKDEPQADPLPARLHLAAGYTIQGLGESLEDAQLRLNADLVDRPRFSDPKLRTGAELGYEGRFFLRAGYLFEEGGGASIGGGIVAGSLTIDIARLLGGLSADAGEPPTFLSLSYRFR